MGGSEREGTLIILMIYNLMIYVRLQEMNMQKRLHKDEYLHIHKYIVYYFFNRLSSFFLE